MTQKIKSIESEGGIRFVVRTEKSPNNLQNYFKNFCKQTGIYGFQYLGEARRFYIERLYWLLFLLISLSLSGFFILRINSLNSGNKIIINENDARPIWDIPFPAVTICPETKIRQTIYNFTDFYHQNKNSTLDDLETFSDLSLLCDNHLYTSGNKTTNFDDFWEIIQKVSPSLQQTLFGCKWSSQPTKCNKLFKPLLTDDGLCYTFNMLDLSQNSQNWTLETGYKTNSTLPRKSLNSGTKSGLYLLLTSFKQDFDYICRGPIQGFKLYLHQPSEIPQISTNFIRVPLNQELVVAIQPNLLQTDENLEPKLRQCLFSYERKLRFYGIYSQENCMSECLGNFTLDYCGCVPYYTTRENLTEICGSGSNICVHQAEQKFLEKQNSCICLPSCTTLSYDSQISQADFNWHKVLESFQSDVNEFPGIQMSRVTIFFKHRNFYPKQRRLLYNQIEIWSYYGGILALFSGISFLTVAELFYFLLLRVVCNIKKYGEKMWGGPKN